MARFLIIDDDSDLRELLALIASHLGHEAVQAETLAQGREAALNGDYDVVLLDVAMPDGSGLDILPEMRALPDPPEVIIITGRSNVDGAEMAIKSGAWAYVSKPASHGEYRLHMQRALEFRRQKQASSSAPELEREEIVGASAPLLKCLELASKAAVSEAGVLLLGETGTGKELFARAVHSNSRRREGSFVVVDCAAIPDKLVESILFGHERGAFTSADTSRVGLIPQAHGGTLFLDEVGELPLDIQKAFLRVLQERVFRPVGGSEEMASDFRVVAATNRDLEDMAAQGHFREDLLYRLKSFAIKLPPLRNRGDDIALLTTHFLHRFLRRYGGSYKEPSQEFVDTLKGYDWPGNVRELANILEQVVAANPQVQVLFPAHLPTHVRVVAAKAQLRGQDLPSARGGDGSAFESRLPTLKQYREIAMSQAEKTYLDKLLKNTRGDVSMALEIAGLSRSRFYALLKKHGIRKTYQS